MTVSADAPKLVQEISALLRKREQRGITIEENGELIRSYDTLIEKLYRSRESSAPDQYRSKLEDAAASFAFDLSTIGAAKQTRGRWRAFVNRSRAIWHAELPLFLLALTFFLLSGFTGWNIAIQFPEYAAVVLPQGALENILDHHAWFQELQKNPLLGGVQIAWNNIRVAVFCFLAGSLLGIGGLYMLCFNGLFFGAMMGYCYTHGFHRQLTDFVLGHGFLELSIIIAAGFASLLYGRAFFQRPIRGFPARLRLYGRSAGIVALGIVPWLLLAATIEAFVSPFDYLTTEMKLLLGAALGTWFWVWTLWPPERAGARSSKPG